SSDSRSRNPELGFTSSSNDELECVRHLGSHRPIIEAASLPRHPKDAYWQAVLTLSVERLRPKRLSHLSWAAYASSSRAPAWKIHVTIAVNNAVYIAASQSLLGDETMILGASNVK